MSREVAVRASWMRWILAAAAAVMLTACGSSSDSARLAGSDASPGAEITDVGEPSVEATGPEAGAGVISAGVSVQLPGVAADGPTVAFFVQRGTGCATVQMTGDLETDDVVVSITRIAVPAEFSILDGPCGGASACLSGVGLAALDACSVPVQWRGRGIPEDPQLAVTGATVHCPDETSCDQATEEVRGDGVVPLEIDPSARSAFTEDPGDGGTDPGDGDSTGPSGGESDTAEPGDEDSNGTPEGDVGTDPSDDFTG